MGVYFASFFITYLCSDDVFKSLRRPTVKRQMKDVLVLRDRSSVQAYEITGDLTINSGRFFHHVIIKDGILTDMTMKQH